MHATLPLLQATEFPPLTRQRLTTLQFNLGYKCNQSCVHCHVNAGPNRTEMMEAENLALVRQVVASLPCYSLDNVDKQRGQGVFDKSIAALQQLNALGYGQPGSGLTLNLVYNPQGATLPPDQVRLQADYKRELLAHFGIVFNELFALANMPTQRFGSTLGLALPGAPSSARMRQGRPHLRHLLSDDPSGRLIRVADHCYGCSA
jgi:hypothetical protein